MSFEVVSAYTLLVGDADGPATVSVHSTADDAWRAGEPESRYWNVTVHRLPIPLPVIAREAMIAGR